MTSFPCTLNAFLVDYLASNQTNDPESRNLIIQLTKNHPCANAMRYLMKQASTKNGGLLMDSDSIDLSKFCSATSKMVHGAVYQYLLHVPSLPGEEIKTKLLELISNGGISENIHFIIPTGASKLTGNGVVLTELGKRVALSNAGAAFWPMLLSIAYTTINNPYNDVYRVLMKKYMTMRKAIVTTRWKRVRHRLLYDINEKRAKLQAQVDLWLIKNDLENWISAKCNFH